MPPDPNPKQPDIKLPAGATDSHCHVFGPADKFPYAPERSYTPPDAGREKLKQLHDFLGIERAVIVQASCHGSDNSAMLDAIAHSNGKYRGVCIANDDMREDDYAALHKGGVRGVRFNFVRHLGGAPDLDVFDRIVERVRPFGWHVVLHLNAENLLEYRDKFSRIPLPIIIDHMARVRTADGLEQEPFLTLLDFLKNHDCWVKICGAERISSEGPPFTDAVPYAQALIEVVPNRVIWGTDFPHPNIAKHMPNDGQLVDLLGLIAPDETTRRKILVDNPHRLYDFEA